MLQCKGDSTEKAESCGHVKRKSKQEKKKKKKVKESHYMEVVMRKPRASDKNSEKSVPQYMCYMNSQHRVLFRICAPAAKTSWVGIEGRLL